MSMSMSLRKEVIKHIARSDICGYIGGENVLVFWIVTGVDL
jgi:hypothetical protein